MLDEKLGRIVAALRLDNRVYESLKVGLKSSFEDEQAFVAQVLENLATQETRLKNRLSKLYLDKLDGELNQDTYQELKGKFEAELDEVRGKIAAYQNADRKYLEYGVRLLELAQSAYSSYSRRSPLEKRSLLNFVCSNCSLDDGEVSATYRPLTCLHLRGL
ncbi:hypothetical protein D3C86_1421870 [compost metagenome]